MDKTNYSKCLKSLIPIRDAIDVINGKWKLQIIIALNAGNSKFTDIERQIPKITPRMLSKELKELEANQLVKRTVYDSQPVTVEYKLTPYADSLDNVIEALHNWGVGHRARMIDKKI